ncbi:MAG: FHA domain-containing protein [Polyangiaceae bacterium]
MRSNPPARASSPPGAPTSPAAAKQHAAVAPGALGAPRAPVDLDRIHRAGTEPGPPQPSTSKAAAPAAPAPVAAAKPPFGGGRAPTQKAGPAPAPTKGTTAASGSAQAKPRQPVEPEAAPQAEPPVKRLPPIDFSKLSQEELMEQARHYVCRSCSSSVPSGHKFCGRCGEAIPPEIMNAQTVFFGDMQNPAKAKLILIRGEGMDGLSFHLKAEQHIVGRNGQLPFPDDPFVSRHHANFFYRNGKLVVKDEGSLNGVYIRVRGTVEITPGDTFLAGEQLFRLELNPNPSDGAGPDGTFFYSSPKHPSSFRLVQLLQGGAQGMTVCARAPSLLVGREGGDLNFPGDLYMSGSHCKIEEADGRFSLTDLNSRNGTYLRLKTERELGHGDYLFIGRKLLRVELNTN